MLCESAEYVSVTADLLSSCSHDISALLPAKLIPAVLCASKSSNSDIRAKAVSLLDAICRRCKDESVRAKIVSEVLALSKTGKTSSAEHRTCLFAMAYTVPPSNAVSIIVLDTLSPLVSKESNELALHALSSSITPHLAHLLQSSATVSASTSIAFSRELGSSKLSTRRLLSQAIGEAIWHIHLAHTQYSSEGVKLLGTVAPAFEANLVTAANNPPATPGGYLEGYVAAALSLGPLRHVSAASKLTESPALQGLLTINPKPSYLLNNRVYGKLPSASDGKWMLRSLEGAISVHRERIGSASARYVNELVPL